MGLKRIGWAIYFKGMLSPKKIANTFRPLYVLLEKRYYIDELYELVVIKLNKGIGRGIALFDKHVIDGAVNLVARLNYLLSHGVRLFDIHVIDALVDLVGVVIKQLGWIFKFSQTGYVQNYLVVVIVGVIVLVVTGMVGVLIL